VICGQPWALVGTAFNSFILYIVVGMTETKMLNEWSEDRKAYFKEYQKTTSAQIPWMFT